MEISTLMDFARGLLFDDWWKYLVTMYGIGKMEPAPAPPPIAKNLVILVGCGGFSVRRLLYPPACSVLSVLYRRDFRIFV